MNFHKVGCTKVEIHSTETPLKSKFRITIIKVRGKGQKLTFHLNLMCKFSINYITLFTIR